MPCSDSSSSIALKLDLDEKFISFDFAKITCGREITAQSGYSQYCKNKSIEDILKVSFTQLQNELKIEDDEKLFIAYLEWDALRSAITQYLGIIHAEVDCDRCRITSIETTEEGTEVALVILPPKELPKIIACGLADQK